VALEGLAFSKMGNATRDLAGLQFSIITYLRYVCQYKTLIISPNTVKKTATGKGNAKKEEMYEALPQEVKNLFKDMNLKKTTGRYDLTDSYWIGKSAVNIIQEANHKTESALKSAKI
jgi:Holliday junction resolvasome RuvABC endonuclease subunit